MLEFQEKRKIRKIAYSVPTLILLVLLVVILSRSTWGVYKKARESGDNFTRAQKELATLEAREGMLSSEIERLNTKRGIEEEIRDKFQVVKSGEHMAVILEAEVNSTDEKTGSKDESLWSKFLSIFER